MAPGRHGPGQPPALRLCCAAAGSSLLRAAPNAPVAGAVLVKGGRRARGISLAITMPTRTAEHSTGQSGGRVLCVSAWWALAMISGLERPVHSAEQPADPQRNYCHRVGLGLDSVSKPLVKSGSRVARRVRCLAVEVLGSARRLVEPSLNLRFWIASQPAHTLFDLTADVSSRARYAVFIHSCGPPIVAGAACSAPLLVSQATWACRQGSEGGAPTFVICCRVRQRLRN